MRRDQLRSTLACVLVASALMGCATLIHGVRQTVTITTEPPGATITILPDNLEVVSPARVHLHRRRTHTALIVLDGYSPTFALIDRLVSGALYWNVPLVVLGVIPAFIAVGVDAESGGAFRLMPEELVVKLRPLDLEMDPLISPSHSAGAVDEPERAD